MWTPHVDDLVRETLLRKQGQIDGLVGFKTEFHCIAQNSLKLDIQAGLAATLGILLSQSPKHWDYKLVCSTLLAGLRYGHQSLKAVAGLSFH